MSIPGNKPPVPRISSEKEAAREKFRQGNGEFGKQPLDKSGVRIPVSSGAMVEQVRQALFAQPHPRTTLIPEHLVSKLSNEQMHMILSGEDIDVIRDEVVGAYADEYAEAVDAEAARWCEQAGLDFDEMDEDERETARQMVRDDDDTDVFESARPTLDGVEMRVPADVFFIKSPDQKREKLGLTLTKMGLDLTDPETKELFDNLADDIPDDWCEHGGWVDVQIMFNDDPVSVAPSGKPGDYTSYEVENPQIALVNHYNGDMMVESFPGTANADLGFSGYGRHVILNNDPRDNGMNFHETTIRPSRRYGEQEPSVRTHVVESRSRIVDAAANVMMVTKTPFDDDIDQAVLKQGVMARRKAGGASLSRSRTIGNLTQAANDLSVCLKLSNKHLASDQVDEVVAKEMEARRRAMVASSPRDDEVIAEYRKNHPHVKNVDAPTAWNDRAERAVQTAMWFDKGHPEPH